MIVMHKIRQLFARPEQAEKASATVRELNAVELEAVAGGWTGVSGGYTGHYTPVSYGGWFNWGWH